MRKARWVEEFLNAGDAQAGTPEVEKQVTIIGVSRAPDNSPGGGKPQQQGFFAPISQGGSRLTGAGVDGTVQPGKRTGEVHEGEGVLSSNAMQALSPDEFHTFSHKLEQGKLDKNAFRESIGLPPIAGYESGGIVGSRRRSDTRDLSDAYNRLNESQPQQTPASPVAPEPVKPIAPISYKPYTPPTETKTAPDLSSVKPPEKEALQIETPKVYQPEPVKAPAAPKADTQTEPVSYADGMKQGYQTIYQEAQGDSPVGRTIANKTMNDLSARQQWQTIAAQQDMLNNPNLSPEARTAIMSEVQAGHSANSANVAGKLALNAQDRASGAARDLMTYGQNARNVEENAEAGGENAISRRIAMLSSSTGLSGMQSDQALRDMVAEQLGEEATPEMIDREIELRLAASQDQNKGGYTSNLETLLGDMADNDRSVDEVLTDSTIRRNTAGLLGVDVNDSSSQARIDDEIRRRFEKVGRSTVDVLFDNFTRNFIPENDEIRSVEGWDTDLKNTIRDLYTKGVLDEDGNILQDAAFSWPWEDPDTYFKYTDWNGNEVGGGKYDHATKVNVPENGRTYLTSSGTAVTQGDADRVWNNLTPAQREKYFEGGAPDVKAFMDDYFRGTKGKDGKPVPVENPEDFLQKVMNSQSYAENSQNLRTSWTSGMAGEEPWEDGTGVGARDFVYYDVNGNLQRGNKQGAEFGYIWQQLSDKYNNGDLLDVDKFTDLWNDGKGWYVNDDGRITNLDSPGSNTRGVELAQNAYESWTPVNSNLSRDLNSSRGLLLESEAAALSSQWDSIPDDKKASGSDNWLELNSFIGYGAGQWNIKQPAREWVNKNKGKLYKAQNGRLYEIIGYDDPKEGGSTAAVILRDITTGKVVPYSNGGGKSASRPLIGESYV